MKQVGNRLLQFYFSGGLCLPRRTEQIEIWPTHVLKFTGFSLEGEILQNHLFAGKRVTEETLGDKLKKG